MKNNTASPACVPVKIRDADHFISLILRYHGVQRAEIETQLLGIVSYCFGPCPLSREAFISRLENLFSSTPPGGSAR